MYYKSTDTAEKQLVSLFFLFYLLGSFIVVFHFIICILYSFTEVDIQE
jgi:hypothetical protein